MGCLQDAYATYIKLARLWGNYSHTDGQRLTNGQWFKECRRFTQRDIQPYGKCGLIIPALMPVPSIPSSISLIHNDTMKSADLPQKLRGTSNQQPVQQMNWIPVRFETSCISVTSRPSIQSNQEWQG